MQYARMRSYTNAPAGQEGEEVRRQGWRQRGGSGGCGCRHRGRLAGGAGPKGARVARRALAPAERPAGRRSLEMGRAPRRAAAACALRRSCPALHVRTSAHDRACAPCGAWAPCGLHAPCGTCQVATLEREKNKEEEYRNYMQLERVCGGQGRAAHGQYTSVGGFARSAAQRTWRAAAAATGGGSSRTPSSPPHSTPSPSGLAGAAPRTRSTRSGRSPRRTWRTAARSCATRTASARSSRSGTRSRSRCAPALCLPEGWGLGGRGGLGARDFARPTPPLGGVRASWLHLARRPAGISAGVARVGTRTARPCRALLPAHLLGALPALLPPTGVQAEGEAPPV